jgi:hypothetical protein
VSDQYQCAKCRLPRDRGEFRTTRLGYRHSYCRSCDQELNREYRKSEAYRLKRAASVAQNRTRALRAYHSGKKTSKAGLKKRFARFNHAVSGALRAGRLARAETCARCPRSGRDFRLVAWHRDRENFRAEWVADVVWLCRPCAHAARSGAAGRSIVFGPAPGGPSRPVRLTPPEYEAERAAHFANFVSQATTWTRPRRSDLMLALAVTGDRVMFDPDWEPECD